MKRLLFICTSNDRTGQTQEECLDAALTCAAMSFDTEVSFNVTALEASTKSIEQKMEMAAQFGITISVCEKRKNENPNEQIRHKNLLKGIQPYDHVIHF